MTQNKLEQELKDQPKSANIASEKVMEHISKDNIVAYRIQHEREKTIINVVSILDWKFRRLEMEVYVDWDNSPQIIADNRDSLDWNTIKTKIHSLILSQNPWILARVEELDLDNLNQLLFLYYILLTNNWFKIINKVEV